MISPPDPRRNQVAVPLPSDADLSPDIRQRLEQLPQLNNLRMFARVPHCFLTITTLIDELFHNGKIDPKLREYMYLRIAIKAGLRYEYRHNVLFARQLGVTDAEIAALAADTVDQLGEEGNLVCRAAEEMTEGISVTDATLSALLDRFGAEGACEIILLVAWFNLLIRYVESTRVPYEKDPERLIAGGAPLELK